MTVTCHCAILVLSTGETHMFNVIEFRRAKVRMFMASARAATSQKHRKLLVQRARIVHHKMLRAKA